MQWREVAVVAGWSVLGLPACTGAPDQPVTAPTTQVTALTPTTVRSIVAGKPGSGAVHLSGSRQGPDAVVVDVVDVPVTGGFVVVYRDGGAVPGRRIGISPLLPGGRTDHVEVILNEPPTETVYVVLHRDGNGDGVFADPGIDPPAQDGGVSVIVPIPMAPPTTV